MNRGNILLRVDGSGAEGMGRIARCVALANALQRRRYQMTFVSRIDNHTWPDRIRRLRHSVQRTPFAAGSEEDRNEMLREVAERRPVVVVTDSPAIDEEYLALLTTRAPLVISLDDLAETRFSCDLVLNSTLGKTIKDYSLYPGTQLLTGNKYAMVRSEFRRARNVRSTEPGGPSRVLVAMGGGAVVDDALRIAKAILNVEAIGKVDVVLGADGSGREPLDALAADSEGRLHVAADVRDLGLRMTKAHLLIAGGGNTALEAACVGVPMLLLAREAKQVANAAFLDDLGVAQYLGTSAEVDPQDVANAAASVLEDKFERRTMSRSGRMLIDGRGADRLVTATEILLRRSRRAKADGVSQAA